MRHKNLTILFTDMKGFASRTSSQSREGTAEMIRRHKSLLLPIIESQGGRLIKTMGDAFLVSFESPTDAVLTAAQIQETLSAYNKEAVDSDRIDVRIAINTGEVGEDEGDIYGEAVNIAARIQNLAQPGQILFTESTFLSMNKSEVQYQELGYRELKGIPHKIKVYRFLPKGITITADDLASAPNEVQTAAKASPLKRLIAGVLDFSLICLIAFPFLLASINKAPANPIDEPQRQLDELHGTIQEDLDPLIDPLLIGDMEVPDGCPMQEDIFNFRQNFHQRLNEFREIADKRGIAFDRFEPLLFDPPRRHVRNPQAFPGILALRRELEERRNRLREELEPWIHGLYEQWIFEQVPVPDWMPRHERIREIQKNFADLDSSQHSFRWGPFFMVWGLLFVLDMILLQGMDGRSLGKILLQIRVRDVSGARVLFLQNLLRSLAYGFSLSVIGIGFLWALFREDGRTWHDLLTHTFVADE